VDAILPAEAMAEAILAFAERVKTRHAPAESLEMDSHLRGRPGYPSGEGRTRLPLLQAQYSGAQDPPEDDSGQDRHFTDYARFLHENPGEVGLLQKTCSSE